MADHEYTREEMQEIITTLRLEISRLREEIRRLRRDDSEAPPHYL